MHKSLDQVDGEKSGTQCQFRKRVVDKGDFDQIVSHFWQHVNEDRGQEDPASDAHEAGHEVFEELHSAFLHDFSKQKRQEAADEFDESEKDEDEDFDSDEVHPGGIALDDTEEEKESNVDLPETGGGQKTID